MGETADHGLAQTGKNGEQNAAVTGIDKIITKKLTMNSELTEKTDIREAPLARRHIRRPWKNAHPSLPPVREGTLLLPNDHEGAPSFRGWILYDGDCPSCTASARQFDRIFRRRGFPFLPLQTKWVMHQFGLEPGAPLEEMHVLTSEGQDIAGTTKTGDRFHTYATTDLVGLAGGRPRTTALHAQAA